MRKTEIEAEWRKYRLAIIGAGCIFFWWIVWLGQAGSDEGSNTFCRWFGWILGGGSLVLEFLCVKAKTVVITHWVQRQFRFLVDLSILAGLVAVSVWRIHYYWAAWPHNHTIYQGIILWILAGHFFTRGD